MIRPIRKSKMPGTFFYNNKLSVRSGNLQAHVSAINKLSPGRIKFCRGRLLQGNYILR